MRLAIGCSLALVVATLAFAEGVEGGVDVPSGGMCCVGGDTGASGSGGSTPSVTSWVVGVPGGGVSPPSGAPTCTGWSPAANIDPATQPSDLGTVKIDPDGVTAILHYRDCGEQRQFVWIRQEPPDVIAAIALDDIRTRLLAPPEPRLSPVDRGIVNLETWLAVTDPGPESVTASIPGLSVTATAEVVATTWELDDGSGPPVVVECEAVGVAWAPELDDLPAPCGHTFIRPTTAGPATVAARLTWNISWTASNGASGDLDPIVSDPVVVAYPVEEIQTIGTRG